MSLEKGNGEVVGEPPWNGHGIKDGSDLVFAQLIPVTLGGQLSSLGFIYLLYYLGEIIPAHFIREFL